MTDWQRDAGDCPNLGYFHPAGRPVRVLLLTRDRTALMEDNMEIYSNRQFGTDGNAGQNSTQAGRFFQSGSRRQTC